MSPVVQEVQQFQNLFLKKNATIQDFLKARDAAHSSRKAKAEFLKTVSALESGKTLTLGRSETPKRLGIGLWMAGRLQEAEKKLSKFTDEVSCYFTALCLISSNNPADARAALEKTPAKKRSTYAEAAIGRTLRLEGKIDDALDYARRLAGKHSKCPELHYEYGMALYESGDYDSAAEAFDEALRLDPDHREALFSLAYMLYQRGAGEEAIELYEKCVAMKPVHVGAVANLALVYEDMGMYKESAAWFKKLREAEPNDKKIELLSKFASSCTNMYYDDERQRQAVRQERLLAMSIDDFELSIRSRKCLGEMDIQTLGDLVSRTESELLAFNNFGETSLSEVKSILKQKGLLLKEETPMGEAPGLSENIESQNKDKELSLEEIGLSTRVRKCLEGRKMKTLTDVCEKSEKELLELRDFGRASLRELKRRLGVYNVSIKEE